MPEPDRTARDAVRVVGTLEEFVEDVGGSSASPAVNDLPARIDEFVEILDPASLWPATERTFTVLTRAGRVLQLRGHRLSKEGESYRIVRVAGGEEVVIAYVTAAEVVGVFEGDLPA